MRKEVVEWLQVAGWRQSAECSSSTVRAGVSWNLQMMRVPAGRETRRGTDALPGCLASLVRCAVVVGLGAALRCAHLEEEAEREPWLAAAGEDKLARA